LKQYLTTKIFVLSVFLGAYGAKISHIAGFSTKIFVVKLSRKRLFFMCKFSYQSGTKYALHPLGGGDEGDQAQLGAAVWADQRGVTRIGV
jgi:hypothetical protein